MTDWEVFWLMFIICVVLWWVAVTLHGRRIRREADQWNAFHNRYGKPPPLYKRID